MTTMSPPLHRRPVGIFVAGLLALLGMTANAVGIPPAYTPLVVEPQITAGRSEFDLGPALARAKRENKRLYVYLGASDCPYCRRYENFLGKNADELVPHFKPWIVVDLRSTLSTTANRLFIRVGDSSLNYTDFQRAIDDQRTRMLVYPSVWLFDPQLKPLMQMPAGTGTFETVEEQLEILNLVQ
jgi:thiol-disulfide isomerase/thioredoxin